MYSIVTKHNIPGTGKQLHKVIKDGNVTALDQLLHDDLLFILPAGEIITKQIDLDTYRNGELKVDELLPNIENRNIIDDIAVITLTVQLKGSFKGAPFEASYRYIRFWKKFPEGIKIVGGSATVI